MAKSLLDDAFAHHAWATVRLIDSCSTLNPEQLATTAPDTFGSILDTIRHIVASDAFDMRNARGEISPIVELATADLAALRAAMAVNATGWAGLLSGSPAADEVIREIDPDDGYQRDASLGLRLAQALHHGAEHRAQVCRVLTALGIKAPDLGVTDFGLAIGQVSEVYP